VTDQKPAKSVEDGVSPYLQQPLRSFEQAQQDRKRQQRQTADAQVKDEVNGPTLYHRAIRRLRTGPTRVAASSTCRPYSWLITEVHHGCISADD